MPDLMPPQTALTPGDAANQLQSHGLDALGLVAPSLALAWAGATPVAGDYNAAALRLSLAGLRAPFKAPLQLFAQAPIYSTVSGDAITGPVAVLRLLPEAARRLAKLVESRLGAPLLRPVPVGGSGALLRTGDVFVVQFSTSLPGHVRLENVDAKGQTADLGTYTVLVDQLNCLPRDKGIQLQGQPGMERLRFYFYPCLPAEAADKAWVSEFKDRLPACTTAPGAQAAGPSTNAGTNAGTLGKVTPRALVNLAQTNAHVAIAGSTDYQPGDVTLMEALIRHESRGHAR